MIINRKLVLLCVRLLIFLCAFKGFCHGIIKENIHKSEEQNGIVDGGAVVNLAEIFGGAPVQDGPSWPLNSKGNVSSQKGFPSPGDSSTFKVSPFYRSRLKKRRKAKDNLPVLVNPLDRSSASSSSINTIRKFEILNSSVDNTRLVNKSHYSVSVRVADSQVPERQFYRSNVDGLDVNSRNYKRRKTNKKWTRRRVNGAVNNSVIYNNKNDIKSILNSLVTSDSESTSDPTLPVGIEAPRDSPSLSLPLKKSSKLVRKELPLKGAPRGAATEFSQHAIVSPRLTHARTKREIDHTWDTDGHTSHISLGLTIGDEDVVFDLHLNRDLLTDDYFEKQLNNNIQSIRRPKPEEAGMCHYLGFVKDRPGSWAALSTCNGLRGVVMDGNEVHYLEPIPDVTLAVSSPHYLLSHKNYLTNNLTCGYSGKPHPVTDLFHDESFTRLLRYKRDSSNGGGGGIRGPFNANSLSRYVELILVADKTEFEKHNGDYEKIYQRCKDIANIVNALYQPLNIFIALVGVEVWNATDEVEISTDGDKTLTNFLNYRKVRLIPQHPNDNAQLLTGKVFDSGVVGKALKGPICTYQYSGGVNMDHSDSVGLVATTVAHEMGHNFGMEHDTEEDCKCPDKRCIMAPSSGTKSPSHWSSCSHEYLAISFERSMDYCLRNKPTSLFQSPVCGNGFVEPGEQCDCGLPEHCINPCCNATTCMLFTNATCATGHCCDLETCRPRPAGVECRSALHECDLAEYCSGDSEYCPSNFYKEDGHDCLGGKAYCYQGMCRTHEHQCRLLWGPTGKNSHDKCYSLNREGNPNGNCGYNWANKTYKKCNTDDIKCGMMHCKHFNERLEFGMESVSKVSHRFIADKNQGVIPCRVAQVDLGLDMVDPGLAPDGAKCGYKRMCVDQHCMEVASLRTHVCSCNGRGVCNNLGNCHCEVGFSWPNCKYPGLGGSVDSGPASNPNATSNFVVGLFIFFLGIVPLFVVILCLVYYIRGNLKLWWLRKGRPATTRLSSKDGHPRNGRTQCVEVVTKSMVDHPADGQTSTICSPSPPSSQGSKCNSPLLNGHANGSAKVQTQLFGKYEGFTLSPIKDKSIHCDVPLVPPPIVGSPHTTISNASSSPITSPTGQKGTWKMKHQIQSNGGSAKVDISNPSLQTSTNPAVALNDSCSSLQPALPGPTKRAISSPLRRAPNRPKSVPDASSLILNECQVNSVLSDPTASDDNRDQSKTSTVARIASFLSKKEKVDQPPTVNSQPYIQSNTLPRKASKINRESLLQLEISHPMQLQATELPSNLVPVRPAPDPPMPSNIKPSDVKAAQDKPLLSKVSWAPSVNEGDSEKPDLLRIGSVRESSVMTRPPIPKFGSMRAPRPKSLPPARPSQPPPRPPLPMIPGTPETEYFYDDCLNPPPGAPLAAEEEETSPPEGIYATIDEELPQGECLPVEEKKEKKSIFSLLYAKTKKKKALDIVTTEPLYCNIDSSEDRKSSSKENSPDNSETPGERSSTSTEDGGLLSEIVTELVNREVREPQYVNTLNAKDQVKNSLLKDTGETPKFVKADAPVTLTKSSSFPWKQTVQPPNEKQAKPKESSSSPDLVRKSKVSAYVPYSNVKPRGVFSFFKSASNEEAPEISSKGVSQSFDESYDTTNPQEFPVVSKINVNTSISVPISLAASLAEVKAASKEVSEANKRTLANMTTSKMDSKSNINPSKEEQTKKATNTVSSISDSSISVAASYTSATEVKMGSQPRIIFPPDKIINPVEKLTTAASTKPTIVPPPAKKPTTLTEKSSTIAPRGRGSGATPVGVTIKPGGRVTSPNKGIILPKENSSGKQALVEKGKPGTVSVKKPAVAAKVDSGFKAKGLSAMKDKPKEKELSSSSLKDSAKTGVVKKVGRLPSTSSLKSPVGSVASLSRNDVLAAAAKSGPQGTSHVASLQQKFEKDSLSEANAAAKPIAKTQKSKSFKK